jgi:hypothetical protein
VTAITVEARLKKGRWLTDEEAQYIPVLCGRPARAEGQFCTGELGRIWQWTAHNGCDLTDPDNWSGGPGSFTDWTSIAAAASLELVTDWSNVHVGETTDGKRVRIWLAEHESGYCRLPSGDFQILRSRSPVGDSERLDRRADPIDPLGQRSIERPMGRRGGGEGLADLLRDKGGLRDGTPLGLAPGGRFVAGAVPGLPAVIHCPKCSQVPDRARRCRDDPPGATRNFVLPLAFDERRGIWYPVRNVG